MTAPQVHLGGKAPRTVFLKPVAAACRPVLYTRAHGSLLTYAAAGVLNTLKGKQ